MAFRISDISRFTSAVRQTQLNRFALHELQSKIASGKRINSVAR